MGLQLMSRPGFLILSLAVAAPSTGRAQHPPPPAAREAATAPVAVLTTALYNDQANVREIGDTAQAELATTVLRGRLREALGDQVSPYAVTDSAAMAPAQLRIAGGVPCNVRVACALAVGRAVGARWVVLTKVSKTSNLIWLLSAQLIRVADGEIVLDDSTELKGEPSQMVRAGVRIFADRVVRTVRAGGQVNDFPAGEPAP